MRITIDGARLELSAQRACDPERWNPRAGRAKGTKEEIRQLNAYLDSLQAQVNEAYRSLLDQKEAITIENIKRKLKGTESRPRMILEVFQHHNKQVEQLEARNSPRVPWNAIKPPWSTPAVSYLGNTR